MLVNEIFYSLQGESEMQGKPCIFLRLYGCNMKCNWCDTMYAVKGGDFVRMDILDILGKVEELAEKYKCSMLEITGGEPLIQKEEIRKLITLLIAKNSKIKTILIETNGKDFVIDKFLQTLSTFIIDIKTPSSGEESDLRWMGMNCNKEDMEIYAVFAESWQLKFVIQNKEDFDWAVQLIEKSGSNSKIIFSPVFGKVKLNDLASWILYNSVLSKDKIRMQVQLHKIIWGSKKGV